MASLKRFEGMSLDDFRSGSAPSRVAENTFLGSVGLRGLSVPDVVVGRHIISGVVISGGVGDADTSSL